MAKRTSNTNAGSLIQGREEFKGSNMQGVKGAPSSHGWLNGTQFSKQLADAANTIDYHVKSYNTPIAAHSTEHGWIYPDVSHSPSTGRHQSIVRQAIGVKSARDKKMEERAAKRKAKADSTEQGLWDK
jgi:hypothetical protein